MTPLVIAAIEAAISAVPKLIADIIAAAGKDTMDELRALPLYRYIGASERLRLEQAAMHAKVVEAGGGGR